MERNFINPVCRVVLHPVNSLSRFAHINGVCHMTVIGPNYAIPATPGSVSLSDKPKDGVWEKKHTMSMSDAAISAVELGILARSPLVMEYRDERGRTMVSGSPTHPLTLEYQRGGGLVSLTLSGACSEPDTERYDFDDV